MRVSLLCVQTVVVDMLRDEMKKHTESEGFIIVGFPRNISQVKSPVFIVYLSIIFLSTSTSPRGRSTTSPPACPRRGPRWRCCLTARSWSWPARWAPGGAGWTTPRRPWPGGCRPTGETFSLSSPHGTAICKLKLWPSYSFLARKEFEIEWLNGC